MQTNEMSVFQVSMFKYCEVSIFLRKMGISLDHNLIENILGHFYILIINIKFLITEYFFPFYLYHQ